MTVLASVSGHLWTVGEVLRRSLAAAPPPLSEEWTTTLDDPATGVVRLTGQLCRPVGATVVAVFVHGLGGSSRSSYMTELAQSAVRLGLASLRLNLRGADGVECDLYHGGLTADLHAALADPALAGFEHVVLVGLSLGGHVALRYGTETGDERLRALAAVSAPLDLGVGADAIDRPMMAPYRAYLLRRLKVHGARAARARVIPTSVERLVRIRGLREWDSLTVVPRFGFASASDYYEQASVAGRLEHLRSPALLLAAENDPMIPPTAIRPALEAVGPDAAAKVTIRWTRNGGHLAFPQRQDFGLRGGKGAAEQILRWLVERVRTSTA